MDLTAAFEELLKREKAGEKDINIATEYPFTHSPASSWRLSRCARRSLPQLWAKSRPRRLCSPASHMQLIVPTLHILLGIINDIVSRYGAFMAEHLEDTEVQKLQLAQDEKHYASQLAQEKKEKLISSAEEQYKKVRAEPQG
jgi:hypothetical protein